MTLSWERRGLAGESVCSPEEATTRTTLLDFGLTHGVKTFVPEAPFPFQVHQKVRTGWRAKAALT